MSRSWSDPTFVVGEEDHDSDLDLDGGTARVFASSRGEEITEAGLPIREESLSVLIDESPAGDRTGALPASSFPASIAAVSTVMVGARGRPAGWGALESM